MKPVLPKSRAILDAGGVSATDIIMNLFVFFFVAFSLLATFNKQLISSKEERQHTLLPSSSTGQAMPEQRPVVVELAPGEARVDGSVVPDDGLTAAVRAALRPGRTEVLVRAHRALTLGDTVAQVDRIWAAEPGGVALATLVEPAPAR